MKANEMIMGDSQRGSKISELEEVMIESNSKDIVGIKMQ